MALMTMASCRLSTAGLFERPFVSFCFQALVLLEFFDLVEQVVLVDLFELLVRQEPLGFQLGEVGRGNDETVAPSSPFPETAPMSTWTSSRSMSSTSS